MEKDNAIKQITTPVTGHRDRAWVDVAVIVLLTLTVYLWSMPRTVVLGDDGLFLLSANFNGIAHPPGYPLYTLLSHLATWVPVGSIATRVHGFTAILSALTCVCLYNIIRRLLPGNIYAMTGALAFGYSLIFWSQSIIAEVYSLNVLIFLLLLQFSLVYVKDTDLSKRQGQLNWMGFLYGLGLSNHWPLLVLSTPVFLSILWSCRRTVLQQMPKTILLVLVGLLPYAWMVWRSQADPLISFYGPITSWQEFWFYLSREGYASMDSSLSAGWQDKLGFAGYVILETARQFTIVGLVPIVIGFLCQWRRWNRTVCIGLTLGYIGNTFILIALLGFDYDFLHQNIFRVYPLIAYAICAIWLALGFKETIESFLHRWAEIIRPGLLQGMLVVLLVGTILMVNLPANYRARGTWVEDYANIILNTLQENAVLFLDSDENVWTIGYVHHVLGLRPDVSLYSLNGDVYSNRLYRPYSLPAQEITQVVKQFVQNIGLPVYYTNIFIDSFGETNFGLYSEINKHTNRNYQRVVMLPGIRQYIETLLAKGEPADNWEKMHYRITLAHYCRFSLFLKHSTDEVARQDLENWTEKVCDTYQGYLLYAEVLLGKDNADLNRISYLLARADSLKSQEIIKSEAAKFSYLNAVLNMKQGEISRAITNFEQSYKQWSHPYNPALKRIQELEKSGQSRTN